MNNAIWGGVKFGMRARIYILTAVNSLERRAGSFWRSFYVHSRSHLASRWLHPLACQNGEERALRPQNFQSEVTFVGASGLKSCRLFIIFSRIWQVNRKLKEIDGNLLLSSSPAEFGTSSSTATHSFRFSKTPHVGATTVTIHAGVTKFLVISEYCWEE